MVRSKRKYSDEERKQKQREAVKRFREKIRNNPIKYEEAKRNERERYYNRKQSGKIKSILQMSDRERRQQRKEWRERSKRCYDRNKEEKLVHQRLEENTPPATPPPILDEENAQPVIPVQQDDRRLRQGKLRRRIHLRKLNNKIAELTQQLEKEKKKKEKYRMRLKRFKNKTQKKDNPERTVETLLQGHSVSAEVRKKLLLGDIIGRQLAYNYGALKTTKDKQIFWKNVSGEIIKKYRKENYLKRITSSYVRKNSKTETKRQQRMNKVKKCVTNFLEKDECSRLCPGKGDFIKKNNIKKQKRLLNNSLKNLHKRFVIDQQFYISYATFCRFRPFWIIEGSVEKRNTCLCMIHSNISLLLRRLKIYNMINESPPDELCKSYCCEKDILREECLARTCPKCKDKEIKIVEFEKTENAVFERWTIQKQKLMIRGKEKICKKTIKEKVYTTKEILLQTLTTSIKDFLLHVRNIQHQYGVIKELKDNLGTDEVLIHMDFSENYSCKYAEEVQSAHFGGSKLQLSLHTVVTYHKSDIDDKQVTTNCFCTVSENLRHDKVAICAHLMPIIDKLKTIKKNLRVAHFLSDGPTTQYRNRAMFCLIGMYLSKQLEVETTRWHYTEKGHGKGAPDGVGGCLKRTADSLVARGEDVSDLNSFISAIKQNCQGVEIFQLDLEDSQLAAIEAQIPKRLPKFKGVFKTHEVVWTKDKSDMDIRSLSCLKCSPSSRCEHYSIGIYPLLDQHSKQRLRVSDVYSSSSDEEETENRKRQPLIAEENNYVIVAFVGKKAVKHYVGVIISADVEDFTVKFMRRMYSTNKFTFPNIEDISMVHKKDIVLVLSQPSINTRGHHLFAEDLDHFQYLL